MQIALYIGYGVNKKSEMSIGEGENELNGIEEESGLSPEQIEKARLDFNLEQQMKDSERSINEFLKPYIQF